MTDIERYQKLAEDARFDRKATKQVPEPTLDEIEKIKDRTDWENENGTAGSYVDALYDLSEALLVALETAMTTLDGLEAKKGVRVHYSYGVNHGYRDGTDVESIVQQVEQDSQSRINVDRVEERTRYMKTTPWVEVPR